MTELSLSDKETPKLDVKIATELLGEVVQSSTSLELRRDGDSARLEKQNIKGIEFTHAISAALLEHLRDAMVSHDDRHKSELKLSLTAAATLGVVRVDLATLLSSREQQLELRVMDEKEGLRPVQVGRAAILVRVPDAALKISLQMHTAARMQAVAALCARAGQPKEAKALLELAHKRRRLDPPAVGRWRSAQKSHAPVAAKAADASWQLPAAEMLLQSGDTAWPSTLVAAVAAKAADASWQLPAAEMLLRSGDTAWPSTLVALADNVEHDFVKRALEMRPALEANPFGQGAVVLYQSKSRWGDSEGFIYGKIVQAAQLIDGRGWYEFANSQRVPSYSVFAVSSSGVGAVLREAAAAGKVDLVNELLLRGVSPFESDAQATTALHRAAAGGSEQSEEVCRRLCAAGAVGSAQNMQNLTPLDLAVRSKNVRCRRVFEPSASDKDVQEYMEATGVQTSMSEGYLPEATMDAHSPVRKQSGSPVRVTPGSKRMGEIHEAGSSVVQLPGITRLMLAARAGQLDEVKKLILKKGTEGLTERSQRRCTALLMAAEEGHTEVMTSLLENAAEDAAKLIADADADGCTALHLAAGNGHLLAVKKLLTNDAGKDQAGLDRLTKRGASPLLLAAKHGYTDVVKELLGANASINVSDEQASSPLVVAAQSGMKDTVEVLLPETMKALEKDTAQRTISEALEASASSGHAKVTRLLLRATTDKSPGALTDALRNAISGDHEAAARMLIAAGSDLSDMLSEAANGRLQCVKALLEVARSDAPQIRRQQVIDDVPDAMKKAMDANGHDAIAVELLAACIENKHDVSQYLSQAARGGRTELVHMLLNAGAKDTREKGTETALMSACSKALPEVVRILLRSGTPPSAVEIRDESGATALCYAAGYSEYAWYGADSVPKDKEARLECIQLLLEASAENYVSADGESNALHLQQGKAALAMARLASFDKIAECLVKARRKEQMRASVKEEFKVTKLQQGVLEGLTTLQETAQEEAVKAALEERTSELRQWLQDHEDKAVQLWSERSVSAATDASSAALTEGDLVNTAFAGQLKWLQRAKEGYAKREKEKEQWREAETRGEHHGNEMRRLSGEPQRSPPVVRVNDALKLLFTNEVQTQNEDVITIGCPKMLQESGVLCYEVEVEVEFPSASSYWGKSAFGFASRHFDTGDTLSAGVGADEDARLPTSWRAHTEDASWNVGDMVCFAANINLGWIALCKAGDWSDPASRVVVVDDAIKKGVFPALSAGFGSVLFRADQDCTTPPPPEGFWSREAQLKKALLAQDKTVSYI